MDPLVHLTPMASLLGKEVYVRGSKKPALAFLGIPFAEPPVGRLRFMPPETVKLWSGIKVAKEFGPICPQSLKSTQFTYFPFHVSDENVSEDCLYLNVWTSDTKPNRLRPVMVWFHGGAFIQGLSNYFDGTAYASLHDVVFISLNYRVGPFGFMCTEDGFVRGNMGLLDQLEALRWVQRHISAFGGDPSNVTVFGESAGAISIALHLLSPMSSGLFHRAIMQSGSAVYPSACWTSRNASKYIFGKVRAWGADVTSGRGLVEFLSDKPSSEIVRRFGIGFNPVVDGLFMPSAPVDLYASGMFHPMEILLGFNTNEGYTFINRFLSKKPKMTTTLANDILSSIVFKELFRGLPNAEAIRQALHSEYLDGIEDAELLLQRLVDINGDVLFTLPPLAQASYHAKKARTYLYRFDHRPFFSRLPHWVVADHGQEIPYVIGEPFLGRMPDVWSDTERAVSSTLISYWTNFAKTGDPNGVHSAPSSSSSSLSSLPFWPPFTNRDKQLMVFRQRPSVESNYHPERVALWMEKILPLAAAKSRL